MYSYSSWGNDGLVRKVLQGSGWLFLWQMNCRFLQAAENNAATAAPGTYNS
jgi:hypothetical protein